MSYTRSLQKLLTSAIFGNFIEVWNVGQSATEIGRTRLVVSVLLIFLASD